MKITNETIQIICAPSILGLRPSGVENLPQSLLDAGLIENLGTKNSPLIVEDLNDHYSTEKDAETNVLNSKAIQSFSKRLGAVVTDTVENLTFPLVLGGDCSILIGITSALKSKKEFGLIFMDAHADFYEPDKSITGEVADMDLAIVTGRGPRLLTNINNLIPYVKDENVIHIGQRDWEETKEYGSQDIRETNITCFGLDIILEKGINSVTDSVLNQISNSPAEAFWIHFDTDVLSDDLNLAVDYRLPGGLTFKDIEYLISHLIATNNISGITIYNPKLDKTGKISTNLVYMLGKAFEAKS